MAHTPGPWTIRESDKPLTFAWVESGDQNLAVARILCDGQRTKEEANANAHLIANAPETTRQLLEVYAFLLSNMPENQRNTIYGQCLLSGLRSQVGRAYNIDGQKAEEIANELRRHLIPKL